MVNNITISKVSIQNIGKVRESWFEIHLNSNNAEREFEPRKSEDFRGSFPIMKNDEHRAGNH